MSKKVLLINPPPLDRIKTNLPGMSKKEKLVGFYPPLGILYVASYAVENSEHHIEILDCEAEMLGYEDTEERIKAYSPDIVGITSLSFTQVSSVKTARIIRRIDPKIKIVFGGTHPSIYPKETQALDCVDYTIVGEGEFLFTDLINRIDKGEQIESILYQTEFIESLDALPFPARHLLKQELYSSIISGNQDTGMTLLFTSRGCPYKCLFCDRPNMGKRFRFRSAKNVVDEMEECVRMGIGEFLIYDDTFTVNKNRVIDICNGIIERKLDISWDVRARVDTIDYEMLTLMKKAGCHTVNFGVESGSERVLKVLRKKITIEQVKIAFEMAQKAGLKTIAYFVIGSPTETREEILHSIQFAIDLKPEFVQFAVLASFPQTELYKMGLEKGIIKEDSWKKFAESPTVDFNPPLWEDMLSEKELVDLFRKAYRSFYYRPSYVLKRLLSIRSFSELISLFQKGFAVTQTFIFDNGE